MRENIIQENEWYQKMLFDKEIGKPARIYLNKRGITKDTAIHWQLGYSPFKMQNPVLKDYDNLYLKMQGRITIPIYDQNGNLTSISGRYILNSKNKPKYDHYPFPSRSVLFGLYNNKNDIYNKNEIFITEGQLDVIQSWQKGLTTVVSSFGAHCSLTQLALCSRYTDNIYMLYDDDFAGNTGTKKALEYKKYGLNIQTANILSHQDLDEYFRNHTVDDFYTKLNNRSEINILKYKLSKIRGDL